MVQFSFLLCKYILQRFARHVAYPGDGPDIPQKPSPADGWRRSELYKRLQCLGWMDILKAGIKMTARTVIIAQAPGLSVWRGPVSIRVWSAFGDRPFLHETLVNLMVFKGCFQNRHLQNSERSTSTVCR